MEKSEFFNPFLTKHDEMEIKIALVQSSLHVIDVFEPTFCQGEDKNLMDSSQFEMKSLNLTTNTFFFSQGKLTIFVIVKLKFLFSP